ncbi:MAG: hypothetical protein LUC91_07495 [Prevotella sp.]|nr:hypothetical protein [Prevotella sp.]
MEKDTTKHLKIHDFSSYLREKKPELFSDSSVVYELPLTKEIFENQIDSLSAKRMQSEFENFIIKCALRLITPNIKPHTGPDGGGDGKVDAETYEVSPDISDKWYESEEGAIGKEKWAFAISCKKHWAQKLENDVEKAADTKRGYTRILFFSNQYIKASSCFEKEQSLTEKYNIKVEIYDKSWCEKAVFDDGCKDIAIETLNFSDEYKVNTKHIGPLDKTRKAKLDELEKRIIRPINGIDTGYIEELRETYILSRGLALPRRDIEGRFDRAQRECNNHGTIQQAFLIMYDHAWTSFFWFDDVDATYCYYLKLKEFFKDDCSVERVEKLTNILSIFMNLDRANLFDHHKAQSEISFIENLEVALEKRGDRPSSLLYLKIYMAEQQLINHIYLSEPIEEDINTIRPLLLEAPNRLDISFEIQYEVLNGLNAVIEDNQTYEELLDDLVSIIRESRSAQGAAEIDLDRALSLIKKEHYKQAIPHLSRCIHPFEKEECLDDLIKTYGLLAQALYSLGLPYSAEAYLVKTASLLLKRFHDTGYMPYSLLEAIQNLCHIEILLGRIVMYLVWHELMVVISQNGHYYENEHYNNTNQAHDFGWACRFATSNLENPNLRYLPDILERSGMFTAASYLKFILGYVEDLDEDNERIFRENSLYVQIQSNPITKEFLYDLNISTAGETELQTTVHNCTIHVKYNNTCQNQVIAEIFLGSIEALFATMDNMEARTMFPHIYIEMINSGDNLKLQVPTKNCEYKLSVGDKYTEEELWQCIASFLTYLLSHNILLDKNLGEILQNKQEKEKLMDRVYDLLYVKQAISNVLGNEFKNKLEDWRKDSDKEYPLKPTAVRNTAIDFSNKKQQDMTFYSPNKDMRIWDDAHWFGCIYLFGLEKEPPILLFAFQNYSIGKQIVDEWNNNYLMLNHSITIYFIKGIDIDNPTRYRVCIAPNTQLAEATGEGYRFYNINCRLCDMTQVNNAGLSTFENLFKQFQFCKLSACQLDDNNRLINPTDLHDAFEFKNVEFRYAWEIGIKDQARSAIMPSDHPIIPDDMTDTAPVLELLEELRNIRKNRSKLLRQNDSD